MPSHSVPTLIGLAVLAGGLYLFQAFLDSLRGRVLIRIGEWLDRAFSARAYDIVARLPLRARSSGDGLQPVHDLDQVRKYLSGLGPTALFDLPWIPFYLTICYLFHPLLGMTALLIAVGISAGTLASLPRAGRWMTVVKKGSGVLILVMAEYYFVKAGMVW